jgi:hypothetical protein
MHVFPDLCLRAMDLGILRANLYPVQVDAEGVIHGLAARLKTFIPYFCVFVATPSV